MLVLKALGEAGEKIFRFDPEDGSGVVEVLRSISAEEMRVTALRGPVKALDSRWVKNAAETVRKENRTNTEALTAATRFILNAMARAEADPEKIAAELCRKAERIAAETVGKQAGTFGKTYRIPAEYTETQRRSMRRAFESGMEEKAKRIKNPATSAALATAKEKVLLELNPEKAAVKAAREERRQADLEADDWTGDTIDSVKDIVYEADRMRNCYFWPGEGNASDRRRYEDKHSCPRVEWTEGGDAYSARFVVACHYSYTKAYGYYYKNREYTNLTTIRNSLRRMEEAQEKPVRRFLQKQSAEEIAKALEDYQLRGTYEAFLRGLRGLEKRQAAGLQLFRKIMKEMFE